MSQVRTSTDSLMGALKELVAQSERVAKAEARLAVARYTDTARLGARRVGMFVIGGGIAGFAAGYLIYAGYLALVLIVTPWQSALIVSGVLGALSALLLSGALRSVVREPGVSSSSLVLERKNHD
jgi:MFS family permease